MGTRAFPGLAVFDFDLTVAETSSLDGYRRARDWDACRRLAPRIPFYAGIREALLEIARGGIGLAVASSAPRSYLAPFLARLDVPFAAVLGYYDAKGVSVPVGLSRRAAIKAAQLKVLVERYGTPLVFIGDDADDAAGAAAVGVPFIHACWGGVCHGIAGAHASQPAGLAQLVIQQSVIS